MARCDILDKEARFNFAIRFSGAFTGGLKLSTSQRPVSNFPRS
jgi:hypothetical protein